MLCGVRGGTASGKGPIKFAIPRMILIVPYVRRVPSLFGLGLNLN